MAFLADDGSVISLASNPKGQARSDTVRRFEPPYLFKRARPTLDGLPSLITYGQTYSISVSRDATRVVMMSAPSPTRGLGANQRYIPLQYSNGKITINATEMLAPRGHYRSSRSTPRELSHRQVDGADVASPLSAPLPSQKVVADNTAESI